MRNPTLPFFLKTWFLTLVSVLFFLTPGLVRGQSDTGRGCALPAPAAVWPKTVTPTEITIQWQQVPNAVAYQVKVADLTLGQPLTTFITDQTSATVGGLTPGHWYLFSISASSCGQGPFGQSSNIKLQSSIIIVDVILQRDCPGAENPSTWLSNTKQFTLKMTGIDMYRFTFEDATEGALVDFSLAAEPAQLQMETHETVNCTVNATDSLIEVLYTAAPTGSPALVRMWIDNSIAPHLIFSLEKSPDAVVYESFCTRSPATPDAADRNPAPETASADLELTPNPVQDRLLVRGARRLQIADLYGREVRPTIPCSGEMELYVGDLPPGWYVVRLDGDGGRQTKFFLKAP